MGYHNSEKNWRRYLKNKGNSPKLWAYLNQHSKLLNNRKSSIYKNKPKFSIFGIGEYTFAPWKIAVSGFYKEPSFRLLSNFKGKILVVDDTVNFLSFSNEEDARKAFKKLNSKKVLDAINSITFWDTKRPITTESLNLISL